MTKGLAPAVVTFVVLLGDFAWAQQVERAVVDPVEIFSEDEVYLDQDIEAKRFADGRATVVDRRPGMLKVDMDGETFWIYESDVTLTGAGENARRECAQRRGKAAGTQVAGSMGLGCR